jgi:hypothetical protein
MAKPILIIRMPAGHDTETVDQTDEYATGKCLDYNVIVVQDDRDLEYVQFEIITEHNQPQGLSV